MPDGPEIDAAQLADDIATGAAHCFVATDGRESAGFMLFYYCYSVVFGRYIHLEDLYVREQFRRRKLAQVFIRHLSSIAADEGVKKVEWDVLDWNTPARALYGKMGAKDCKESEGALNYRLGEEAIEKLATES